MWSEVLVPKNPTRNLITQVIVGLLVLSGGLAPLAWAETEPPFVYARQSDGAKVVDSEDMGIPVWAAQPPRDDASPLQARDIPVRTAQHLHDAESPLQAAAQLLAEEQRGTISAAEGNEAQQLVYEYEKAGLYDRANYIASKLGADWDAATNNHFWLVQVQTMLARGEARQAEQALRRLHEPLGAITDGRRQSLLRLALIGQQRFDAVVASLEAGEVDRQLVLQDYYNYSIALINRGQRQEGLALLDELGEVTVETNEALALRDRINLGLGWSWLADNRAGTARTVFKRISLKGPSSSMALLGLGWTELAPDGLQQTTVYRRKLECVDNVNPPETRRDVVADAITPCMPVQTSPMFKYYRVFDFAAGATGSNRYRQALIPWTALAQRGTHDPAVQEALLAIGYAQARLKNFGEAGNAYRLAIKRYEEEIKRLAALEAELRKPDADPLGVLARKAQPGEFVELRSRHSFDNAVADLEGLQAASLELADVRKRLDRSRGGTDKQNARQAELQIRWEQLQGDVSASRKALNASLQRQCLDDIAERRKRLNQYMASASLSLAKLYDKRTK